MKCGMCGGRLKPDRGRLLVNLDDQDIILTNLAILKCASCREEFLTPESDKRVEKVIQGYKAGASPIKRREVIELEV